MFYLKGVTHQVSVWVRSRSWGIPCSQAVWGTSTRFSRFSRFILMEQGLLHYRGVPHLVQAGTLCWKLFYFPVWFGGFCCNSDFFGSMKKQHSLHCTALHCGCFCVANRKLLFPGGHHYLNVGLSFQRNHSEFTDKSLHQFREKW